MPAHLLSAVSGAVAVVAAGLAVYYWRRATGLYSLLVEGANRYEELRARAAVLEQAQQKSDERFKLQREAAMRLTQGLDDARDKAAELGKRLEAKEHEARFVADKLELQKGFLEQQLAKAQDQHRLGAEALLAAEEACRVAEGQSLRAEEQLALQRREAREAIATLEQELTLRDKDWQAKLRDIEQARAAAAQTKGPDAAEFKRLKRKLAQFDRLYSSMKGLREMSEERNRNWEVALRKLSVWVLQEAGSGRAAPPSAIGPLVGQALHAIGAQLIDDQEGLVSGAGTIDAGDLGLAVGFAGASLAATMDPEPGPPGDDEAP